MGVQTFDDGTQLLTDGAGNSVSYTDTTGRAYVPDRSIVNDFLSTLSGVGQEAIKRAFSPAPTQRAAGVPAAPRAGIDLGGIALLALAGFLLKKLLS